MLEGDCLDIMPTLDPVDAICCDPPYHLTSIVKRFGAKDAAPAKVGKTGAYARHSTGFMGQTWDGGDIAFRPETWKLCLDVLKPGGHMLVFGGSRTFHRVACAVEDAGFEIRDTIMWLYGSGFPKSHDVSKGIDKAAGAERENVGQYIAPDGNPRGIDRGIQGGKFAAGEADYTPEKMMTAPATEAAKQWEGWGTALKPSHEPLIWARKPLDPYDEIAIIGSTLWKLWSQLWLMLPANAAKEFSTLNPSGYGVDVSASAQWTAADVSNTRDALCARMDMSQFVSALTSSLSTVSSWSATLAASWDGLRTSTIETALETTIDLKTLKSCLLAITPESIIQVHDRGAWSNASASPVARYFNAAVLKLEIILELSAIENVLGEGATFSQDETGKIVPGCDPVILARKPLSEKTIAANVLRHSTGALNIDGCRVEARDDRSGGFGAGKRPWEKGDVGDNTTTIGPELGRWPANVIHDGSPEVMEAFARSGEAGGGGQNRSVRDRVNGMFGLKQGSASYAGDSGTAARFFYCAKADKGDRLASKHPTVKPVDLIAYLVRLITPPGGTVLDPFAGSGTTGMACIREGFDCILIEREAEYVADIKARLAHVEGTDTPLFKP